MIKVTRLNKAEFYINPDRIEFAEETPDTVLSMESGRKVVISETVEEVIDKIIDFRRKYYQE